MEESWFRLNEYIMAINEGVDVIFVTLLVLMMDCKHERAPGYSYSR